MSDAGAPFATRTVSSSAGAIGFGDAEIIAVIRTMERIHFHKSMDSVNNPSLWQDVYHVPYGKYVLYIKYFWTEETGFRLMSSKEK